MVNKVKSSWTFLSNHGHVYFVLATHQDIVLREVATLVGITERAVQGIVHDLEAEGYLERKKSGRTNRYIIPANKRMRHPLEAHVPLDKISDLIKDHKS